MDGRDSVSAGAGLGGGGHGEGLRVCTDVPHVTTHLTANDPVRMREFAQSLSAELKRRAELLGRSEFAEWHTRPGAVGPHRVPARRPDAGAAGRPGHRRPARRCGCARAAARRQTEAAPPLPRLVVLVDDLDALVSPALGSPGRPAAGSVVRALEAVAREGERLGVHLVAATARGGRTAETEPARRATLRVGPGRRRHRARTNRPPGRGRLDLADGRATAFQGGPRHGPHPAHGDPAPDGRPAGVGADGRPADPPPGPRTGQRPDGPGAAGQRAGAGGTRSRCVRGVRGAVACLRSSRSALSARPASEPPSPNWGAPVGHTTPQPVTTPSRSPVDSRTRILPTHSRTGVDQSARDSARRSTRIEERGSDAQHEQHGTGHAAATAARRSRRSRERSRSHSPHAAATTTTERQRRDKRRHGEPAAAPSRSPSSTARALEVAAVWTGRRAGELHQGPRRVREAHRRQGHLRARAGPDHQLPRYEDRGRPAAGRRDAPAGRRDRSRPWTRSGPSRSAPRRKAQLDKNYAQGWQDLGAVDGKQYGVYFKAANKSLVWYNTKAFENAGAKRAQDLEGLPRPPRRRSPTPASPPVSVGGADGWTLTDWFENVYLSQAGPEKYDQLAKHEIKWTDPSVKEALTTLAQLWGKNGLHRGRRRRRAADGVPRRR